MKSSGEEELFITRALVAAERAERLSRMKRIFVSILAVGVAVWFAIKAPGPEFDVKTLLIILFLALAVCTAKVLSSNDKNTRTILQAIAQLRRREVSSPVDR